MPSGLVWYRWWSWSGRTSQERLGEWRDSSRWCFGSLYSGSLRCVMPDDTMRAIEFARIDRPRACEVLPDAGGPSRPGTCAKATKGSFVQSERSGHAHPANAPVGARRHIHWRAMAFDRGDGREGCAVPAVSRRCPAVDPHFEEFGVGRERGRSTRRRRCDANASPMMNQGARSLAPWHLKKGYVPDGHGERGCAPQ